MPRYKYNELADERNRLLQQRADLVELAVNLEADATGIIREDAAGDPNHEYNRLNRGEQRNYINNVVEEERTSITNEIEDIDNQLLTVGVLMDNWSEPTQPPPLSVPVLEDSFDYGPGSPPGFVPDSPPYAPGSPPGSPPGFVPGSPPGFPPGFVPDSPSYAPGSPLSPVPNSPTGSQRSLPLSDLDISDESPEIINVEPTPPGSPNITPPPRSPQVPSAPTRRRGGTKKRKGKKRKVTKKKKTAKKGKKTKKR